MRVRASDQTYNDPSDTHQTSVGQLLHPGKRAKPAKSTFFLSAHSSSDSCWFLVVSKVIAPCRFAISSVSPTDSEIEASVGPWNLMNSESFAAHFRVD